MKEKDLQDLAKLAEAIMDEFPECLLMDGNGQFYIANHEKVSKTYVLERLEGARSAALRLTIKILQIPSRKPSKPV